MEIGEMCIDESDGMEEAGMCDIVSSDTRVRLGV